MIESSSIDCRAVIAVLSSLLRVLPLIGKRIPKVIVLNSSCQEINFWTRMDHVLLWLYGLLQSFDFAPLFSKSSLIIYFLPSGCQGEYSNVRNIFSLCRDFSNLPYPATKPQSPSGSPFSVHSFWYASNLQASSSSASCLARCKERHCSEMLFRLCFTCDR